MILNQPEHFDFHRALQLANGDTPEMANLTPQEIVEAFNGARVPDDVAARRWVPFNNDDYDGTDFNDEHELNDEQRCEPVIGKFAVVGKFLYLFGDDGNIAHFFKYVQAQA